ncbi:MAG TPA: hypothetical protein VGU45_02060 [Microvirga sp.]|nr:hypothetical protein [Microvirga sp.]
MTFSVPLPPSSNKLYANAAKGRVKTVQYRAWIDEAGWILQSQRPGRIEGDYAVFYALPGLRKGADQENRLKALSDLLVRHKIVQDDSLARLTAIGFDESLKDVRVVVRPAPPLPFGGLL